MNQLVLSRPQAKAKLTLPASVATETFGILGKRGSGKSNTAVVFAEEMHRLGIPWVAIDPKGDWWGIRSAAAGGPGLPIPVFGGYNGDLPLEPTAGAFMAQLVHERALTCVIDVSGFDSKAEQTRFLTAFAGELFRQAHRHPHVLHLFLEEAHEYLPQQVQRDEAKLVHAFAKLMKQGRTFGLGLTLVSQRSASLNKDALTQCEALIAMRTPHALDQKPILDWVTANGGPEVLAEVRATLARLEPGEGWVISPNLGIGAAKIQFRQRATFDSGATPQLGQRRVPATMADIDLSEIEAAMADTIEKATAADPKALQAKVARLERELAARPQPVESVVEKIVEVEVVPDWVSDFLDRMQTVTDMAAGALASIETRALSAPTQAASSAKLRPSRAVPMVTPEDPRDRAPVAAGSLGGCPAGIIAALVQYPEGISLKRAAAIAGYSPKKSTVRNALSTLRTRGYVEGSHDHLTLTPAGIDAAGGIPELPTGPELLDHWRSELGTGAPRVVFDCMIDAWPRTYTRQDLEAHSGHHGSTFRNALSRLRTLGLVDGDRLNPDLMDRISS